MGAFYDIYGFSSCRNKKCIERFLEYFTTRTEVEHWKDCEIFICKNEKYGVNELSVPINNLTEVLDYGIEYQNHGFAFYLGPRGLNDDIKSVILKFTYDSSIIFGLSIEESDGAGNDNYQRAHELENKLPEFLPIKKSFIGLECPPADDEEEFDADIKVRKEMNEENRESF